MNDSVSQYPLSGVRVVELATVIAAPSATQLLCAYGAEVIKIEKPEGDDLRFVGQYYDAPYEDFRNPLFTVQNSNKRFIALNLKTGDGKEAFLRLIGEADVFVTNLRQDALERLGIHYDALKDRYPALIYAHLTSFGRKGPAAHEPGYDVTAFWARSGCMADWPEEGDAPFAPTYGFGDNSTGMALLSGILMALFSRERKGKGSYVSTSLFACGTWYNANGLVFSQFRKVHMNRDLENPVNIFATVYQCADGRWISLYSTNYERSFPKFVKLLGLEELMEDPRNRSYAETHGTGAIREAVQRCQEVFLTRTAAEWKEYLSAHDIACEVVQHTKDLCMDEQARENGYVKQITYAGGLEVSMASPPIQFSEYGRRENCACGGIGQDTDSILEELGYSEAEIQRLRETNAVR